jgi:hypothetical protein
MRKESFYETLFKENCKPDAVLRYGFYLIALGVSAGLISYNNHGKGVIISGIYNPISSTAMFYWIKPQ